MNHHSLACAVKLPWSSVVVTLLWVAICLSPLPAQDAEQTPVPMITPTGVVNAASFVDGPVAPGELITIFGAGLGPTEGALGQLNNAGRVDNSLAGTMVLFDGVPAPLFFVRDDQINAQVPYGVDGKNATSLQVVYGTTRPAR